MDVPTPTGVCLAIPSIPCVYIHWTSHTNWCLSGSSVHPMCPMDVQWISFGHPAQTGVCLAVPSIPCVPWHSHGCPMYIHWTSHTNWCLSGSSVHPMCPMDVQWTSIGHPAQTGVCLAVPSIPCVPWMSNVHSYIGHPTPTGACLAVPSIPCVPWMSNGHPAQTGVCLAVPSIPCVPWMSNVHTLDIPHQLVLVWQFRPSHVSHGCPMDIFGHPAQTGVCLAVPSIPCVPWMSNVHTLDIPHQLVLVWQFRPSHVSHGCPMDIHRTSRTNWCLSGSSVHPMCPMDVQCTYIGHPTPTGACLTVNPNTNWCLSGSSVHPICPMDIHWTSHTNWYLSAVHCIFHLVDCPRHSGMVRTVGYGTGAVGHMGCPLDSPSSPMVQWDGTDSGIWHRCSGTHGMSTGQSVQSHGTVGRYGRWDMAQMQWDTWDVHWTVRPVPWFSGTVRTVGKGTVQWDTWDVHWTFRPVPWYIYNGMVWTVGHIGVHWIGFCCCTVESAHCS